jgi:hypothetical protein
VADNPYTMSRRRALAFGGVAPLSILDRPGESGDGGPDAELLQLYRTLLEASREANAAGERMDRIFESCRKLAPEPPIRLRVARSGGGYRPMMRDEIDQYFALRSGEVRAKAHAEFDAWVAESAAIEARLGLPAAEAAYDALDEKSCAAEHAFFAAPARTALGLHLKLRTARERQIFPIDSGTWAETVLRAILSDSEMLALG